MKIRQTVMISGIDPVLLDQQRMILAEIEEGFVIDREDFDALQGVLNLLDVISDELEDAE